MPFWVISAEDSIGAAFTVKVVLPVTPLNEAEIVAEPADTPLAAPLGSAVTTAVLDDLHMAWLVRFCVLPSE
jgi:hypothetical protein